MSSTIITDSDASSHAYAGLEKPDTNPATWIDPQDVDDAEDFASPSDWRKTHKPTYYEYLDNLNRGYNNGVRRNKPFYTYQTNLHASQILSDKLGLTAGQKSQAETWFRVLDFEKLGHPAEVVGVSICARIVHETERDRRECHPQTPIEKWPSEFREMYEPWGMDYTNRYEKVYGQVDHRIRNWSFENSEPASEQMDKYGTCESLHEKQSR